MNRVPVLGLSYIRNAHMVNGLLTTRVDDRDTSSLGVVMRHLIHGRKRQVLAALLIAASSAGLAACQNKSAGLGPSDSMATASTQPASFKETALLGKKWQADPTNVPAGLAYANGLEALGQTDKQMQVLQSLMQHHPEDGKLKALYGKKLLTAGRSGEAIPVLEAAAATPVADWRLHSALGSAYDQQGEYGKARNQYQKALTLSAGNLSVMNNLGMSYALEGNLKQAEQMLRDASRQPNAAAQPRIRQNLALVVGLQGRFEEARKIASEDLPPEQVEANMAYLQKMLSQPNTWQQLSGDTQG
jgi:Flp pilus assembly protein TadD